MRTRSFRITAASATVMSGEANEIAIASASGRRVSAEKLLNMPQTLSDPRPNCPSGLLVRTAEASSPPKCVDDHDRNDRKRAAEKHHLANRCDVAQLTHQG